MDVTALTPFIGETFFPIAMCVLLFIYIKDITKQRDKFEVEITEKISQMSVALSQITVLIDKWDSTARNRRFDDEK